MRAFWIVALILCLAPFATFAATSPDQFAGDWAGAMDVGGGHKLRFILHLVNTNGTWSGTSDSPDQGASGIPLSKVSVEGKTLSFEIPEVEGEYEGTLDKDGKTIMGTWWQGGRALTLDFTRDDTSPPAPKTPIVHSPGDVRFAGDWAGAMDVGGGQKLRFILHLVNTNGAWSGTTDSPDQGSSGIPITKVSIDGTKLYFEIWKVGGNYEGALDKDGKTITGTWRQNGMALTLDFTRGDASTMKGPNRPQEPKPPFPYQSTDVTVPGPNSIKLAGTLTAPNGNGPFPAVVLIPGSGASDRDESIGAHKPFLVLSDHLTRQGIAVLRLDDRGVGKSAGDFSTATTEEFAQDALAAVAYLKTRKEIDTKKIGLVGHSEGGMIAPIVASRSMDVAFIVMMAGVGVRPGDLFVRQISDLTRAGGASDVAIQYVAAAVHRMCQIAMSPAETTPMGKQLDAVADSLTAQLAALDPTRLEMVRAQSHGLAEEMLDPWFRYWLTLKPEETLRQVKQPVLAINGSLDLQVASKENLPAIEKALREGGNKDVTIEELPGLNHLFQTATTGSPMEYATIEETMSPVAMKKISDWILARTSAKKK